MADTFLNSVDTERLDKLFRETNTNVQYFNTVCNSLVEEYSSSLDNLMKDLYTECIRDGNAPTATLERYYLELSNMMYFMGEKLEKLGIYADMSESAAKEVYSKAYLNNQVKDIDKKNKTTVSELQAIANTASQYENVVGAIYSRAYKIVKYKVESGKDMMNTLRKIISHRMAEMDLNKFTPNSGFTDQGV